MSWQTSQQILYQPSQVVHSLRHLKHDFPEMGVSFGGFVCDETQQEMPPTLLFGDTAQALSQMPFSSPGWEGFCTHSLLLL